MLYLIIYTFVQINKKLNQKSKNINSTNYHKKASTLVVAIPASNGVTPTSDYVADCVADCVALVNGVALVSSSNVKSNAISKPSNASLAGATQSVTRPQSHQ